MAHRDSDERDNTFGKRCTNRRQDSSDCQCAHIEANPEPFDGIDEEFTGYVDGDCAGQERENMQNHQQATFLDEDQAVLLGFDLTDQFEFARA